ncbi:MAG: sugar porter family MFS transporter [Bacteroidota bacterium]|nr:sugar porter family MFS transporter [Bacteroidota bacterium]MDP4214562.1 sugar porter family MFS transporter [Bacteroidota bacterium]
MLSYPVRIALIAALGGFLFGFETVVISGAEKTLEHLWSLNTFWHGFTVTSSLLGTILGSMIAGVPAKKYGRKKVLQVIALFFIVAAVGCASISAWILFIVFRIIGGLAVGASSVVAPMYISEIAPSGLRGRLAGSFQVNIVAGICIAFLTNYVFNLYLGAGAWRWMLGVMAVPSVLFWILLRSIPESPRWLILNSRDNEAIPVMEKLGEANVPAVIQSIRDSVKEHKEALFQKRYAKPIVYAMLLAMFNQFSGINAILYYAPRIFEMAGFSKNDAFGQSIFLGVANLTFTLLAMSIIDKFGRKKLLLIGSVGTAVFLGLTAHAFHGDVSGNSNLLVYLIGFIAFFAFSQGAVIWVFISEIFPNSVRSQGGSLGSSTHWVMAAAISWIFPSVAENLTHGVYLSFVFFALMMVLQLIFIWWFMPETKGRSLEQIQKDLGIA